MKANVDIHKIKVKVGINEIKVKVDINKIKVKVLNQVTTPCTLFLIFIR